MDIPTIIKRGLHRMGTFLEGLLNTSAETNKKLQALTEEVKKKSAVDLQVEVPEIEAQVSELEIEVDPEAFKGNDGKTPEKGVDYWTEEDVKSLLELIKPMIPDPIPGVSPDPDKIYQQLLKKLPQAPKVDYSKMKTEAEKAARVHAVSETQVKKLIGLMIKETLAKSSATKIIHKTTERIVEKEVKNTLLENPELIARALETLIPKPGERKDDRLSARAIRGLPTVGGTTIVSGGSGGGTWGTINGTLSNQTDLQTALNAKANTSHTHAIADVTNLQTGLDAKIPYTGANATVNLNTQTLKVNSIQNSSPGTSLILSSADAAVPDNVVLRGGAATAGDTVGGEISIEAGTGLGAGNGGQVNVAAGTPGVTGNGGAVNFVAGSGGATSGNGGDVNFTAGSAQGGDSDGGDITFTPGAATGAGIPGKINLVADTVVTGNASATNLSGTNTGDQTSIVGITGTKAQFNTAVTDGNFLYEGDVTAYTDEMAQDAVGNILADSATIDFSYVDATPEITAIVKDSSITNAKVATGIDAIKIADGTVTNAEFQFIGGLTSDAQTQLDAKQPLDSDLTTIAGLTATTDNFIQSKSNAWASRTVAEVKTDLGLTGTNSGDQLTFKTIAVSGQSDVVADAAADTLNLVAGANITITTDASTDSVTIAGSAGGSYTDEEAQDAVGGILTDSSTVDFTYDDGANTITAAVKDEGIQDIVGAMVAGNTETGIAVTYDDTNGKLDFDAQTAGDARYALKTGTVAELTEAPANQGYTGITVSLTYGESIVPGDLLYFRSDGKVWKADANVAGTVPVMGLALATASSGSNLVLLQGIYRDDTRYNFTVGGLVYLSTTAGSQTQTQPSATGEFIQIVGIALHADRIYFKPELTYITHV